jgi:hypothetical protein
MEWFVGKVEVQNKQKAAPQGPLKLRPGVWLLSIRNTSSLPAQHQQQSPLLTSKFLHYFSHPLLDLLILQTSSYIHSRPPGLSNRQDGVRGDDDSVSSKACLLDELYAHKLCRIDNSESSRNGDYVYVTSFTLQPALLIHPDQHDLTRKPTLSTSSTTQRPVPTQSLRLVS